MTGPQAVAQDESVKLSRERTNTIAVIIAFVQGVVACGGTTQQQSLPLSRASGPRHAPVTSSNEPPVSNPTPGHVQRVDSSNPPDSGCSSPPSASDHPTTIPTIRETAIGYQSPQEQTRRGNVDWRRWVTHCRGTPLHHCPSGHDPDCARIVHGGKEYRVKVDVAAPRFTVFRDKEALYRGSFPANWAMPPIYTLAIWGDSWLVEVHDELVVDGQSLNQQMGYSRAFNWVLWHGQPMYFFERGHVTRISYGGAVLPVFYDEVAHNLCCSEAIHNITNCSEEVSFYAKRGPKWYYVQLL